MAKDFRGQTQYVPGIRNNNPGNLRPGDNWQGMSGVSAQNFIIFKDMDYGLRALGTDITNKYMRGFDTVRKIIYRYAPPSENNTEAYIKAVSKKLGIGADDKITLTKDMLKRFMMAVAEHENGSQSQLLVEADFDKGISMMSPALLLKIKNFSLPTRK